MPMALGLGLGLQYIRTGGGGGGGAPSTDAILLETGFYMRLETNDAILLE
jgi:hypothetical protein